MQQLEKFEKTLYPCVFRLPRVIFCVIQMLSNCRTPDFILRSRSVSVTKNDSDISDRPATAADSLTSITDNLLSFGDFVDKTKDRPSASDFF